MEKMMWTKPMAVAEQFMPNEYISACFYIACESGNYGHSKTEAGTGCRWAHNQVISVLSGDIETGADVSVREINVVIGGRPSDDRTCYFSRNNKNDTVKENVKLGDRITWYTDVGYSMEHYGTFRLINDDHPLRS